MTLGQPCMGGSGSQQLQILNRPDTLSVRVQSAEVSMRVVARTLGWGHRLAGQAKVRGSQ